MWCCFVLASTATDHCDLWKCENGGTCVSSSTGHSCQCMMGFTGDYCARTRPQGGIHVVIQCTSNDNLWIFMYLIMCDDTYSMRFWRGLTLNHWMCFQNVFKISTNVILISWPACYWTDSHTHFKILLIGEIFHVFKSVIWGAKNKTENEINE